MGTSLSFKIPFDNKDIPTGENVLVINLEYSLEVTLPENGKPSEYNKAVSKIREYKVFIEKTIILIDNPIFIKVLDKIIAAFNK